MLYFSCGLNSHTLLAHAGVLQEGYKLPDHLSIVFDLILGISEVVVTSEDTAPKRKGSQ